MYSIEPVRPVACGFAAGQSGLRQDLLHSRMSSNDQRGSWTRADAGCVPNHVPTSVVLARLLAEAPPDYVSLAWLMGRLQERSFGLVMLLLALVSLLPGAGILAGILLAFPAIQMILGRESPSLPRFLASRRISTRHIA